MHNDCMVVKHLIYHTNQNFIIRIFLLKKFENNFTYKKITIKKGIQIIMSVEREEKCSSYGK